LGKLLSAGREVFALLPAREEKREGEGYESFLMTYQLASILHGREDKK
jgi:hypothetical protein